MRAFFFFIPLRAPALFFLAAADSGDVANLTSLTGQPAALASGVRKKLTSYVAHV